MSKNILVINMGMKSIRSIVFDSRGNKLTVASRTLSTRLTDQHVEQDPNEWWISAIDVVRESLREIDPCSVHYITVTSSASCLICANEDGDALDACIMVSDKRDAEERQIVDGIERRRSSTDVQPGQNAGPMLAKILWVKRHRPELFSKTCWFLAPNDYLIAKLTGKYVTDTLNAQKCDYDIMRHEYPKHTLDEMGVEEKTLPAVVRVGTKIGHIKEPIAKRMRLPVSAEVIITTYDAICSFFGSGVWQEGEASDVSGTVTAFRAISYQQNLRATGQVFITPYPQLACNIVGGSNNLGGGLIEWTKQCYYNDELYPYEVMEKEASESHLGAGGLIFLPYLLGERAPIWDDTVRGVLFGIERFHTRKDIARAIFESTAFIDRDFVEAIEKTGVHIRDIRVSGGLARVPLINQIKADVTGKEIKVLSDFETTASGAALLALLAAGEFADMGEAIRVFSTVRMIIKPNMVYHAQYERVYAFHKRLYQQTRALFSERKELCASLYVKKDCTIENL